MRAYIHTYTLIHTHIHTLRLIHTHTHTYTHTLTLTNTRTYVQVILQTMRALPRSIRMLSPIVDFVVTFENEEVQGPLKRAYSYLQYILIFFTKFYCYCNSFFLLDSLRYHNSFFSRILCYICHLSFLFLKFNFYLNLIFSIILCFTLLIYFAVFISLLSRLSIHLFLFLFLFLFLLQYLYYELLTSNFIQTLEISISETWNTKTVTFNSQKLFTFLKRFRLPLYVAIALKTRHSRTSDG